ncbi:MAG: hypothetical protein ABWZ40_05940, partial [Caulobacterales bacterium]
MTEKDNALRAANLALAEKILGNFGRNMDGWYDNLHQDAVLEFPFGALVGIPPRLEGKESAVGMFSAVAANLHVQFSEIKIQPLLDPNLLLAEYRGKGSF